MDDSTLVFPGSIRTPGEDKGLTVEISKLGGDIVMATDKAELGRWPLIDVTMHRIDATSFAFVAEGDSLIFTPSEPTVFAASALVTVEVVEGGRRKRRRTKKKPVAIEPSPVRSEDPTRKEPKTATRDSQIESVETEPAETTSGGSSESITTPPAPESREAPPAAETESAVPPAEPDDAHEKPTKGFKPKRWVGLVDIGRRNRFFGLDRVPIDESLRGLEHEHSWDHRVATSSGLASHVCTICGRIKFR